MISEKKLAALLFEEGLMTAEQVEQALQYQKLRKATLKESVLKLNFVSEDDLIAALVSKFDYSYIRLKNYNVDKTCLMLLPKERCIHYKAIPIAIDEDMLTVAMADPTDVVAIDEISSRSGKEVFPVIAKESEISDALSRYYTTEEESIREIALQIDKQYASPDQTMLDLLKEDNQDAALIVQLADRVIENAYYQGASDIHIEPYEDVGLVRYRIDGILTEALRLPVKSLTPMIARIKIMANLDISERRLPLDGRIQFKAHSKKKLDLDLRVSTIPVAFGEKAVMRLLDRASINVDIAKLGYSPKNLELYKNEIVKPYGMVLHVGPTGSGKTTALYAALAGIATPDKNIQTAEDPIEYNLPGINQCLIRADIGFDFARALRAFLRQDPDVIMIGEIRDGETAEIAIEAALTGHMVFSTMHTNEAAGTVARFLEMDVEPFLVSSAVVCVVAQRLVRTLCRCKLSKQADHDELHRMGLQDQKRILYRPSGCKLCKHSGYRGRLGVHEVLVMSDPLRHLVTEKAAAHAMHKQACEDGMVPLFQDGLQKVLAGKTSLEELLRVAT